MVKAFPRKPQPAASSLSVGGWGGAEAGVGRRHPGEGVCCSVPVWQWGMCQWCVCEGSVCVGGGGGGDVSSCLGVQHGRSRLPAQSYSVSQWARLAHHSPPTPGRGLNLPANSRCQTTVDQPAAVTGARRPGPEGEAAVGSQQEVRLPPLGVSLKPLPSASCEPPCPCPAYPCEAGVSRLGDPAGDHARPPG